MIAILQCCLLPFISLSKDNALIIHLSYRHYLPIYPIHWTHYVYIYIYIKTRHFPWDYETRGSAEGTEPEAEAGLDDATKCSIEMGWEVAGDIGKLNLQGGPQMFVGV